MDVVSLSRLQFALTSMFHYIYLPKYRNWTHACDYGGYLYQNEESSL